MAESVATAEKIGAEKKDEPVVATEAQQFAEMQRKLAETEAALKASEEESKKLAERTASLEKDARTKRFSDIINDVAGNGTKRFIGASEDHLSMMEFIAQHDGETSDRMKKYVEQQQAHAEQMRSSDLFKEVGRGGGGEAPSAYAEIESKARAMCEKDTKLTMEQAISSIAESDPKLYRRYLAEQQSE